MISIKTVAAIAAICLCATLFVRATLVRATRTVRSQSPSGTKPAASHALKQVATFDLPGPAGKRFDYLTVDSDDGYLLSAHLGAGILYVINLRDNKIVKAI